MSDMEAEMIGFMEAPLTRREKLKLLVLADSSQNYEVRDRALALLRSCEEPAAIHITNPCGMNHQKQNAEYHESPNRNSRAERD